MKILVSLACGVEALLGSNSAKVFHSNASIEFTFAEPSVRNMLNDLIHGSLDLATVLSQHDRHSVSFYAMLSRLRHLQMLSCEVIGGKGIYFTTPDFPVLRRLPEVRKALQLTCGVTIVSAGDTFELAYPAGKRRLTLTRIGFSALAKITADGDVSASNVDDAAFYACLLEMGFLSETTSEDRSLWPPASDLFDQFSRPQFLGHNKWNTPINDLECSSKVIAVDRARLDHPLLHELRVRRSQREQSAQVAEDDIAAFFGFLLESHVEHDNVFHNFPAAGGIYDFNFFVAVKNSDTLGSDLYAVRSTVDVSDKIQLCSLRVERSRLELIFKEAGGAWGNSDAPPTTIVLVAFDGDRLVKKYGERAMRLMLMDSGVLIQVFYSVAQSLGLSGCALGTGSMMCESLIRQAFPRERLILEFALGRTEVNRRNL